MTTTSTRRRWSRSAVARVSAAKSSTVCGSSRPTVASMRSATRTPLRRNGFRPIRCLTRLRRSQVVRKAEYASTSRFSTSTPIASYPSVKAQLSVVPRPASGSRTVRRGRSGSSAAATVMFSRTRVSCSLVLPGYLGMVSRSSSNRSPSGASTGRKQAALALEDGEGRGEPAEDPRVDAVCELDREVRHPGQRRRRRADEPARSRRRHDDLRLGRRDGRRVTRVHPVARRLEQDEVLGHASTLEFGRRGAF